MRNGFHPVMGAGFADLAAEGVVVVISFGWGLPLHPTHPPHRDGGLDCGASEWERGPPMVNLST